MKAEKVLNTRWRSHFIKLLRIELMWEYVVGVLSTLCEDERNPLLQKIIYREIFKHLRGWQKFQPSRLMLHFLLTKEVKKQLAKLIYGGG